LTVQYCLDTNIVIAILNGNTDVVRHWLRANESGNQVGLSAFSYYEVKRGLSLPLHARKYALFEQLVQQIPVLMADLTTFDVAAGIYQVLRASGILLEDADILIAATALEHDAVLITNNTKHFARIESLKLDDWL
jgi:tRNA(fMet)-specific endonuclease VapC